MSAAACSLACYLGQIKLFPFPFLVAFLFLLLLVFFLHPLLLCLLRLIGFRLVAVALVVPSLRSLVVPRHINCANALALPAICRIPFLTIVSMRGEWGEFIPWQMPMGQGTPGVLEAMDVRVFRADYKSEVGSTVAAAAQLAHNTRQSAAVLLSQKMIGAKQFKEG